MLSIYRHALLCELKQCIKNSKRIGIEVISFDIIMQALSCDGKVITATNSNRIKRKEC